MNATLQELAALYRRSTAARTGPVKDYTFDWEKFLRVTNRHDGDARELAEQELLEAERVSGGVFLIDRHPRTGEKEVLRLKRDGGEAWLFCATGWTSPTEERKELAAFFQEAADYSIPEKYSSTWKAWCSTFMELALNGGSIAPFNRDDRNGNATLLRALSGILNWKDESLIRYASSVICRDSKALQTLSPRLLAALRAITRQETIALEDFGITETPRAVFIHGPLALELAGGRIDFGLLSGPVAISATDLEEARSVESPARLCLTVENESVFLELVKRAPDLLLIQTSFPGAATRLLFERLPADLPCYHFGDSDPAGFDILRDLREKTGREFTPILMRFRNHPKAPELTDTEKREITRLLASPMLADVYGELHAMSQAGTKGNFEQESVPLDEVLKAIG